MPKSPAVDRAGLCTGCGIVSVFAYAMRQKMVIDAEKGVYLAQVTKDKCTNCGICSAACPGQKLDLIELNAATFGEGPADLLIGHYLSR